MIDRRELVRQLALQEFVKSAADPIKEDQSWMDYLIDKGADAYSTSRDYLNDKMDQAGKYLDSSPRYKRLKDVTSKRLGGYADQAINYIDPDYKDHQETTQAADTPQNTTTSSPPSSNGQAAYIPYNPFASQGPVQPMSQQQQVSAQPMSQQQQQVSAQPVTKQQQASQQLRQAPASSGFQVGKLKGGYYDLAKKLRSEAGVNYTGSQLAKMFGNKSLRATDSIDLESLKNNKALLTNADISSRKALQSRKPVKPAAVVKAVEAPATSKYTIPETKLQLGTNNKSNQGFSISSPSTNSVPKTQNNKPTTNEFDEDLD